MTKEEAVKMIDDHKNVMVNPLDLLKWTWLRVIVNSMDDEEWDELVNRATETLAK